MVSPMPSMSSAPIAAAFLTVPWRAVPASVTPMWSGTSGSSRERARLTSTVVGTPCALADRTMSEKPRSRKCSTNEVADPTSFSTCVRSSRSAKAGSSEPAFTPMRMGMPAAPASSMTASTRSQLPMLPGFTRRAAAPRRHASMASAWSKWMSATTGSGEAAQISERPSSAAGGGHRHAYDLAAGLGEPRDLRERGGRVGRVGRAHGLHGHGRAASHLHVPHHGRGA